MCVCVFSVSSMVCVLEINSKRVARGRIHVRFLSTSTRALMLDMLQLGTQQLFAFFFLERNVVGKALTSILF